MITIQLHCNGYECGTIDLDLTQEEWEDMTPLQQEQEVSDNFYSGMGWEWNKVD